MPDFTLAILHNGNAESRLIPDGDFGGVARFASLIASLKEDAAQNSDGVLTLSAGNNTLSGPQYRASLDRGELPFYDALAMDIIGYDAGVIGHHELSFGPDTFADFVQSFESNIPFLSANLDVSPEPRLAALADAGRIAPSVILNVGSERVGLIGVTTPDITFISSPRDIAVNTDTLSAVRSQVDALASEGVNKIILISHLYGLEADTALISGLSNVDAVIARGSRYALANDDDLLIPGDEDSVRGPYPVFAKDSLGVSVPIATVLGDYKYVGRLSLTFNEAGQVLWVDKTSGVSRVAGGDNPDAVPPDPEILSRVIAPVQDYISHLSNERVGEIQVPIVSEYPDMRIAETNEGNLVADALLWQARKSEPGLMASAPAVAIFNGGGIGHISIPAPGVLTELDLFSLLRFPDLMVIVRDVAPADFKDILENAVSRVEDNSGRFPHGAGYTLIYDPSAQPRTADDNGIVTDQGSRVIEVTLADGTPIVRDGAVVDGAPSVNLVTNRFLASGGDQYPLLGFGATPIPVFTHDALAAYVRDALNGLITPQDYPERGQSRLTTP